MDFNAIIKRVIAIITKPTEEWEVIKNESMTVGDMFLKYAIFLAAIPAIAGFIGFALIGVSIMGFTVRYPMANALIWTIVTYVMYLVGTFVLGLIIDALATTFGAQKDTVGSMKAAVFASTPGWIAGILFIIPALSILAIIGSLYGLYLLYLGIKIVKNPPQDKLVAYFIVSLIIAAVVMWLSQFITRTVAFGHYAAGTVM
ncbi:MAG: Yip1 family protein [Candidatus Aminicenantes bacterium]|nr:Yip1 family protein [Candidatus Aminicenantes bacterium]